MKNALGILDTAPLPLFVLFPNALPGISITFEANFLAELAQTFLIFSKRSPNPSASIALSITVFEFCLLHVTYFPTKTYLPVLVVSDLF